MIARFEHHPVQMELALATLVCGLLLMAALFIALFVLARSSIQRFRTTPP